MLKAVSLMILAACLSVPVGLLLWGLSSDSPPDAMSGGTTSYLMLFGSYVLMGIAVILNTLTVIVFKRIFRFQDNFSAVVGTTLQGLLVGFSFNLLALANIVSPTSTSLIFLLLIAGCQVILFGFVSIAFKWLSFT